MDDSMSVLSTPIKRIRNLTIHSPEMCSPILYPTMGDFPINADPISDSMVDRGYSRTLSNAVLRELDTRADEISANVQVSPSQRKSAPANRKRYSGVHKPLFSKMDSISSHYAATRSGDSDHEITSSATKKRRTLNGPEEIFFSSDDPSPTRRKVNLNMNMNMSSHSEKLANPANRQNARTLPNDAFAGRLQPLRLNVPLTACSPAKQAPVSPTMNSSFSSNSLKSSPFKSTRISPSKGSMDLHGILSSDDPAFAKPDGPVRIRQSSLQMAGVKPADSQIPTLSRKSSSNELQKPRREMHRKPSMESLNSHKGLLCNDSAHTSAQKSPSVGLSFAPSAPGLYQKPMIPTLQRKSSIPSLQKKPSIPSLQKKPSIPSLQKKPSIPSLQKKPSIPSLQKKPSVSNLQKKPPVPTFQNPEGQSSAHRSFPRSQSDLKSPSHKSLASMHAPTEHSKIPQFSASRASSHNLSAPSKISASGSAHDLFTRPSKPKVTVPQPFSLYAKPTISSSQKGFGSQNSLNSVASGVSPSASQRSLNRFQKFKSRFS